MRTCGFKRVDELDSRSSLFEGEVEKAFRSSTSVDLSNKWAPEGGDVYHCLQSCVIQDF